MIEFIGKVIPNVAGDLGDAISVFRITEQKHLVKSIQIICIPLGPAQDPLGQEFQMGSQADGIQVIGIQLNAVGLFDNFRDTADKLQRIVGIFAVHLSSSQLQRNISGFLLGQFRSTEDADPFQRPQTDLVFPGIQHLGFREHQIRKADALLQPLQRKADVVR